MQPWIIDSRAPLETSLIKAEAQSYRFFCASLHSSVSGEACYALDAKLLDVFRDEPQCYAL